MRTFKGLSKGSKKICLSLVAADAVAVVSRVLGTAERRMPWVLIYRVHQNLDFGNWQNEAA
jgi:hypothetical protein